MIASGKSETDRVEKFIKHKSVVNEQFIVPRRD